MLQATSASGGDTPRTPITTKPISYKVHTRSKWCCLLGRFILPPPRPQEGAFNNRGIR